MSAPAEYPGIRVPSKSKNAATFEPPGPALMPAMTSSTATTGGEAVISLRLPVFVGHFFRVGPKALTRHRATCLGWGGAHAVPGRSHIAVTLSYGHSTMRCSPRAAKSVGGEIPLVRGR